MVDLVVETEVGSECAPPVLGSMVEFRETRGNVLSRPEMEAIGA